MVFDNDGLLLDTEEAWTRAERALFERHGRQFTIEHKRELLGSSSEAAALKLEAMLEQRGRGGDLMDELHELVTEEAGRGVSPRPGALALLKRLGEVGLPLAVASNSPVAFVRRTLGVAGLLEGVFDAIVSAEEVQRPKPHPDVYLEACLRLGADPRSCVALEDSPPGARSAAAAGMLVIGVPYFAGETLPGCNVLAGSLADDAVATTLGIVSAAI